jgi:starch synthase
MTRVLHVCSEVTPFAKTGGLGDVCAALPRALHRRGFPQVVVMPRYRIDPQRHALAKRLEPLDVRLGARTETIHLYEGRLLGGQVPVYLIDHPWFDRAGIYGEGGKDYDDNGLRFALLCRAALDIMHHLDTWPDVVHAHDWQAGLAPVYARRAAPELGRPVPRTVFTIHNLAFQGMMPKELVETLDLGWDIFTPEGAEFFGQLSYLKAGLAYADRITTVSPRYAREIQTAEHGAGLDGFLRQHAGKLVGILNGIDTLVWNPATDPHLPVRYDPADLTGKAASKTALQKELRLPVRAHTPLIASISRLTEQKGLDLIVQAADELGKLDAQFVFLGGSGEKKYEDALTNLTRRFSSRFVLRMAYDERLAHLIEAGADFFLMPSRFEPCGLNQLYSHRYGTLPIVRATGGLDDTVVDYDEVTATGNGFKFEEYTADALVSTIKRALTAYHHPNRLAPIISRAMQLDHSWDTSAIRYADVYRSLTAAAPARAA